MTAAAPREFARFDPDRGGIVRRSGGATGFDVCMYKDNPGVFIAKNGQPVSDDDARKAGFDLKRFKREARKNELMANAARKIEAQMAEASDEAETQVEAELARMEEADPEAAEATPVEATPGSGLILNSSGQPRETATRKIIHQGFGKWDLIDKSTGQIIQKGLKREEAEVLLLEG